MQVLGLYVIFIEIQYCNDLAKKSQCRQSEENGICSSRLFRSGYRIYTLDPDGLNHLHERSNTRDRYANTLCRTRSKHFRRHNVSRIPLRHRQPALTALWQPFHIDTPNTILTPKRAPLDDQPVYVPFALVLARKSLRLTFVVHRYLVFQCAAGRWSHRGLPSPYLRQKCGSLQLGQRRADFGDFEEAIGGAETRIKNRSRTSSMNDGTSTFLVLFSIRHVLVQR